jgi:hypothetical protein
MRVDHLVWGNLCAFATLWILSCDVGGAYRQKAINLAASGLAIIGAAPGGLPGRGIRHAIP